MKPLPEKMECGYGEEFTIFSPQYAINALIDHLTDYEAEIARRLTKLDNRIQTIANNQLGMKREETWEELAKSLPTQYKVIKEQPKYPREVDIMFALSSATSPNGKVDGNKFYELMKPIVAVIKDEAIEAYKARLLELVKEIWKN